MSIQIAGYRAMCESISSGKNIVDFLNLNAKLCDHPDSADMFGGAVACLKRVFLSLRDAGLDIPTFKDELINAFLAEPDNVMTMVLTNGLAFDRPRVGEQLGAMACVVQLHRARVSFQEQPVIHIEAPTAPTAPTAQQPMLVHVVTMPQRITHQTVERDDNDEIISTTKIEKDFA